MNENTNNLPKHLKVARERKELSLRSVEKITGISNAYLSQLENGMVKQPSPMILHKLAKLYDISYSDLFELAGYPLPHQTTMPSNKAAARLGTVTAEEERELLEYLDFIRSRRKKRDDT